MRKLARHLEHEEPGVSGSILEGLEEIFTVIRAIGLPHELRRSIACTNIVENALGTVRQVSRNVLTPEERRDGAQMDFRRPAGGPEGHSDLPQGVYRHAAHPPKGSRRNT